MLPHAPGFWGPVTSSVDWCESNYVHSYYVAELFNTLSSLAMVAMGALGFWLHRGTLERRFLLAFALVALVGIGSVAFHGTLRFELQMLDELPMLYTVIVLVYALVEDEKQRKYGRWFPWALFAYGVVATYLCAFTRGQAQFLAFQLSFGLLELFSIYRAHRLFRRSTDPVVRRLFRRGIGLYAAALIAWFVDIRFCGFVSLTLPRLGLANPELHAVWHVVVSLGLYLLILQIAYERQLVLGARPELHRVLRVIPYVGSSGERELRSTHGPRHVRDVVRRGPRTREVVVFAEGTLTRASAEETGERHD
jgi:dihydroceramidase